MGSVPLAVLFAAATCGTRADLRLELMADHAFSGGRGLRASGQGGAGIDVGDVAVLEDRGDLVVRANPFDLDAAALRFTPNRTGGYDVARMALPVEAPGDPLDLDGTPREIGLPFAFPFFGRTFVAAFVHADGFVSLGAPDPGPGEPSLGRMLSGPPRVAGLLADLAPELSGSVSVRRLADRIVFAWHGVPGVGQIDGNTFSISLHSHGGVDVAFAGIVTREAVVGVSPGEGATLVAADLSAGDPRGRGGALLERFAERERIDLVAVLRRFYATHPDAWEQVVVYTTRPLNPAPGSLAFEVNVRNEIRGIGLELHDRSADWGSAGILASVVYMDAIDAYLEVDGFEILGHETGHRWLARMRFQEATGAASGALLGRGDAHWSFFLDSDASVLEGNEIEETGAGRFATTDIVRRYSPLDQYAMGLRAPAEVPRFFHVAAPDDFRPDRTYKPSSGPEVGVSFSGQRREVGIEDVVAVLGPRLPAADSAPRLLRQAYVLVADATAVATAERVSVLDRIRSRFPAWYAEATEGRGQVATGLR